MAQAEERLRARMTPGWTATPPPRTTPLPLQASRSWSRPTDASRSSSYPIRPIPLAWRRSRASCWPSQASRQRPRRKSSAKNKVFQGSNRPGVWSGPRIPAPARTAPRRRRPGTTARAAMPIPTRHMICCRSRLARNSPASTLPANAGSADLRGRQPRDHPRVTRMAAPGFFDTCGPTVIAKIEPVEDQTLLLYALVDLRAHAAGTAAPPAATAKLPAP